ncbi:MAG: hypothetical protein HWN66_14335 [Candidatus Helarchaeota archaeon]|nr:hypothetical protein [Candidatus Helarchaeota archaeon]
MSLQECLASRKDCSGKGRVLKLAEIENICESTHQAIPSKTLFIVASEGGNYKAGIYEYNKTGLKLLTEKVKTKFCMELYPELERKEPIELKDLIDVGLAWQYLSLKVGSMELGVSQRARRPKKINKFVNEATTQNYHFLYSVAVRERDRGDLVEDTKDPISPSLKKEMILLETPSCYKDRAIYEGKYEGIPLGSAIFDRIEKKSPDNSSLFELSQLLWACQGETDHTTHGNRDSLEKNGYGRVHASGCAGQAVYPLVFIEDLASIPKGGYWYNPIGLSALNRWLWVDDQRKYDHLLHQFIANNSKSEIESQFGLNPSSYMIVLCVDSKKPCSGFAHGKIGKLVMDPTHWADVEAGMALAGLQLQANALGLKWQKQIIPRLDQLRIQTHLHLEQAERSINNMAQKMLNPPKNDKLSLKSHLTPVLLFSLL